MLTHMTEDYTDLNPSLHCVLCSLYHSTAAARAPMHCSLVNSTNWPKSVTTTSMVVPVVEFQAQVSKTISYSNEVITTDCVSIDAKYR